jgi:hypothetical protein
MLARISVFLIHFLSLITFDVTRYFDIYNYLNIKKKNRLKKVAAWSSVPFSFVFQNPLPC